MKEPNIEMRDRAVNFIQIVENTKDSYPSEIGHGIQKDAIQNGWDARLKKEKDFVKNNWKFEFELLESPVTGQTMFIMTDYGTSGLTGNMTAKEIKEGIDVHQVERWARWEALAWNKESKDELGARGQGKMILIGGSKDYEIYYDTLRSDKSYRAGWTKAKKYGCPLYHMDNEDAKQHIKQTLGIDPIDHVGTRIIIMNPQDELVEAIRTDKFLEYIEETWWPTILHYDVKIAVKYDDVEKIASIPHIFPIKKEDEQNENYKIWVKDNIKIKFNRKTYTIRKIAMAYNQNWSISDNLIGLAVFRGGMKITSVNFPTRSLRDFVYGYVEFDEELDRKLYEIELSSHYDFKTGGIWNKIKDKIEEEMEAFGNKKLGLGLDRERKEKTKRTNAENKAMHVLRAITKNWPFPKTGKGTGGGGGGSEIFKKPLGMQLHNLKFPNDTNEPRLDYGDELSDFQVSIFNKTDKLVKLKYAAYITSGDRPILTLDENDFTLDANQDIKSKNYDFLIERTLFQSPGEYKILLKLVNLQNNKQVDKIVRRFWVATEPKLKGPFEMQQAHFSELAEYLPHLNEDMEWELESKGDNQYIFWYNLDHPSYLFNEEGEVQRAQYISEIALQAALELLIKNIKDEQIEKNDYDKLPFDVTKIISNDPLTVYREATRAISILKAQANKVT